MVAEIGGLAGIMIGFSILDLISFCDKVAELFSRNCNFAQRRKTEF